MLTDNRNMINRYFSLKWDLELKVDSDGDYVDDDAFPTE